MSAYMLCLLLGFVAVALAEQLGLFETEAKD